MIAYPASILGCVDKIFAGVLIGGIDPNNPLKVEKAKLYKVCQSRFSGFFPSNVFTNEHALLYEVINSLSVKYFTVEELGTIIDLHRDLILDSPYINLDRFAATVGQTMATPDEKVEAFRQDVIELFIRLSNTVTSEEEFVSACRVFSDWYTTQYYYETVQISSVIMSETGYYEKMTGKRSRTLKGMKDSQLFYNERMATLRAMSEESRVSYVSIDETWFEQQEMGEGKAQEEILMNYGLDEIDSTSGKLRRGNMLGIIGPPKGGKTRFSNFLVSRALAQGLNVAVWPLEGSVEEWMSCQIAAYIRQTSGISVNTKTIIDQTYDANIRKKVSAARLAISTGQDRGRLTFIKGTAYVEDFLDVLRDHYENKNPYDIVVIDSLVNIQSRSHQGKVERISDAYMSMKDFIENGLKRKVLGIMPAQLKQSVVDELRKGKVDDIDVTAGGESAETIRTPDEVIGLFSSKDEQMALMMRIYSVASRHNANFEPFVSRCDYGCCWLESDSTLNE